MKILLADDHTLFREGLRHVMDMLDDDVDIVEAEDFTTAIQLVQDTDDFDLALIDLNMPGMDSFQGLKTVKESIGSKPIVVVSASDSREDVLRAMDSGAAGYIPKTLSSSVLVGALKLVLSGGVYLPLALLQEAENADANSSAHLTPRQREVLDLLAHGLSNKEIGSRLTLSEGTVKLHVTALMKALEVNNRTKAVIKATELGILKK
ncbi:MAG: response regulator transcription factor [Rhodospirillales bacterium]|jgi:DNA-binding NarL/FixJ family response regulator|nr:response regulator transcription factor [Rhodospirillales bacterium]MBT3906128.1 response regulator transcription factor [Rhodospirillaceae bacterium]MBT5033582.1 response regulator transcription factor [Rhodospirillaceae bacterium]MBT6218375.1 response regulator transcription factor [Rhodospirillaceae bacterium]MBT6364009.1 response regulator transcription factor [Rhodospirillaceae bacterium]